MVCDFFIFWSTNWQGNEVCLNCPGVFCRDDDFYPHGVGVSPRRGLPRPAKKPGVFFALHRWPHEKPAILKNGQADKDEKRLRRL
jgi:hypothetical protein